MQESLHFKDITVVWSQFLILYFIIIYIFSELQRHEIFVSKGSNEKAKTVFQKFFDFARISQKISVRVTTIGKSLCISVVTDYTAKNREQRQIGAYSFLVSNRDVDPDPHEFAKWVDFWTRIQQAKQQTNNHEERDPTWLCIFGKNPL